MASSDSIDQKTMEKLLGISFWRRRWGLAAGLMVQPIFMTVGLITASYPFNSSEIPSASKMIVEFSSLLAAGWTFGFSYFWPSTERAAKQMRAILMKTKPLPKDFNLLDALKNLRMPFWTFLLAVFGLILMIWSAFLAVGAALYSFGPFILLSMWSLAFGSAIMVGTWIQLYVIRDVLGFFAELVPPDIKG